ncbi:TrkH family potassium uptake protein [Treponema primitia]|uniref:TrkH family potassium uptake protein n=1 Tax=Treponema primitia TaxID=88058 RepID=UPI0039800E73
MRSFVLLRILIIFLGMVAAVMLIPLALAVVNGEGSMVLAIGIPAGIVIAAALPAFFSFRKDRPRFRPRDGFLLVFLTWILMSLLGTMPFFFSGHGLSFTDAFFESACGFATTGATTITNVEALPKSLLLWRSMSHWIGGMGIVLLTVALMPLLGVGSFQLVKAEAPGTDKERITPRITDTAKLLWICYCVLTAVLAILFRLGGMDWLDAICHSFTTMASGGISTKNAGLSWYNSAFIDIVSIVFMLLAGLNFNLYYRLLRGKFKDVINNTEGRAYLLIFIIAAALVTITLVPVYGSVGSALRYGAFQTASVLSTTGSVITDYTLWPAVTQGILFCLMFVGGCSASTAGGIKVIRHVVLWKQTGNELRRILYPQGVFGIQLNKKVGRKDVVYGVAGFVFLYAAVVAFTTLAGAVSGLDIFSAFSTAVAVLCNIGTGFGAIGPGRNFSLFPDYLKWVYSFAMIAGRLELWTVLVLFTPEYWRR